MIWGYHYFWKHPYKSSEFHRICPETGLSAKLCPQNPILRKRDCKFNLRPYKITATKQDLSSQWQGPLFKNTLLKAMTTSPQRFKVGNGWNNNKQQISNNKNNKQETSKKQAKNKQETSNKEARNKQQQEQQANSKQETSKKQQTTTKKQTTNNGSFFGTWGKSWKWDNPNRKRNFKFILFPTQ